MLTLHPFPAFKVAALVVVGVLIGDAFQLPLLMMVVMTTVMFVVFISLFIIQRRSGRVSPWGTVFLLLLCLLAGATKVVGDRSSGAMPEADFLQRPVTVGGKIVDQPVQFGNRIRFLFRGSFVAYDSVESALPFNVLVTVRKTRKDTADINLEYGRQLLLRGVLSRPPEERNPGDFNARQYYEASGVPFFMVVNSPSHVALVDSPSLSSSPLEWFMRVAVVPSRSYIQAHIDRTIGGEEGEFLKGILIGDRTGISLATRQAFVNSGVAHILAVSGSNVAVLVVMFFFVFEVLRAPKRIRVILTCVGLLFYVLLTGSQPPVVRATVMAIVFLLASLAEEKSTAINSLGVAALMILAYDARQLFDVGFQLSFVAVLSIVYLFPKANEWIRRIPSDSFLRRLSIRTLQVCAVSAVATVGTLPFTAIYFGRVSVVGILTNIFVIPAAGLSIVLGFVSSLAGLLGSWVAEVYASVNQFVLWLTIVVARASGDLSIAYVETLRFTVLDSIPYYALLSCAFHLSMKPLARRFFILFLLALNVAIYVPLSPVYQKPKDKVRVSFIDVGQGDAVLIETPEGKNILIDAGSKFFGYDMGERAVAPFLKRRNISTIDLLVVSHPHGDHVGGVPHVFREFEVRRVIDGGQPVRSNIYREYFRGIEEEGSTYEATTAGTLIAFQSDVRLYVIYPTPTYIDLDTTRSHANLNNTSVVLKLCYGAVSFLYAGDAELEAEREMVEVYGEFLQSTLLKVGHHGSSTSTTERFLQNVRPTHAVISVGRNNKFQHPSSDVLQRLVGMNVDVSRTDEDGAIVFETDGLTLTRIEWR